MSTIAWLGTTNFQVQSYLEELGYSDVTSSMSISDMSVVNGDLMLSYEHEVEYTPPRSGSIDDGTLLTNFELVSKPFAPFTEKLEYTNSLKAANGFFAGMSSVSYVTEATENPTQTPTREPTASPTTTRIPTESPTITFVATEEPTTSTPTTAHPSFVPTLAPTNGIPTTDTPTITSTSVPTTHTPTVSPSVFPTEQISQVPSELPTGFTRRPTFTPTTSRPTSSVHPSSEPSLVPTTSTPTLSPTTNTPTNVPATHTPTVSPTVFPTEQPSQVPSELPTESTQTPTFTPTTFRPTQVPTNHPTTQTPTSAPIVSTSLPTQATAIYTLSPTANITNSIVNGTSSPATNATSSPTIFSNKTYAPTATPVIPRQKINVPDLKMTFSGVSNSAITADVREEWELMTSIFVGRFYKENPSFGIVDCVVTTKVITAQIHLDRRLQEEDSASERNLQAVQIRAVDIIYTMSLEFASNETVGSALDIVTDPFASIDSQRTYADTLQSFGSAFSSLTTVSDVVSKPREEFSILIDGFYMTLFTMLERMEPSARESWEMGLQAYFGDYHSLLEDAKHVGINYFDARFQPIYVNQTLSDERLEIHYSMRIRYKTYLNQPLPNIEDFVNVPLSTFPGRVGLVRDILAQANPSFVKLTVLQTATRTRIDPLLVDRSTPSVISSQEAKTVSEKSFFEKNKVMIIINSVLFVVAVLLVMSVVITFKRIKTNKLDLEKKQADTLKRQRDSGMDLGERREEEEYPEVNQQGVGDYTDGIIPLLNDPIKGGADHSRKKTSSILRPRQSSFPPKNTSNYVEDRDFQDEGGFDEGCESNPIMRELDHQVPIAVTDDNNRGGDDDDDDGMVEIDPSFEEKVKSQEKITYPTNELGETTSMDLSIESGDDEQFDSERRMHERRNISDIADMD